LAPAAATAGRLYLDRALLDPDPTRDFATIRVTAGQRNFSIHQNER
jgi:hypothetical protein